MKKNTLSAEQVTKVEVKVEMAESKSRNLRKDLLNTIGELISSKGWRQEDVAANLKITQPRASHLLTKKEGKFSLEFLLRILMTLDHKVQLMVTSTSEKVVAESNIMMHAK